MGKKLFDYVIGNPPYNADFEDSGENGNYAKPVYNDFMDAVNDVADKVELVHPARFLFNAGSTPKTWNEKMLNDPHFKVLSYEADSSKVFSNTDIKGGIAITYHDNKRDFGAIGTFTAFPELNSIIKKVVHGTAEFKSFSKIVFTRTAYRMNDKMHKDHPEALSKLSKGHPYDVSTNIFERLPQIYTEEKPNDGFDYIRIYGRAENNRTYRWVRREYIIDVKNTDKWKVFVPKSNGSGALGEVLTTPVIGQPVIGHTESFISIGCFDNEYEAQACYKYIASKFARCMLGVLKVTQDNPPDKWEMIPMQNFATSSDIDWSKSIHEIDLQLYRKYGLSEEEIAFIETHVKEMA